MVDCSVSVVLPTEERKAVVVLSTLTVVSAAVVLLQVSVAEVSPTPGAMVDATVEMEVETAVSVAIEGSSETMTSRAAITAVSSSSIMPLKPSRYDMRPPMRSSKAWSWTRVAVFNSSLSFWILSWSARIAWISVNVDESVRLATRLTLVDLEDQDNDGNQGNKGELVLGKAEIVKVLGVLGDSAALLDFVVDANVALLIRHLDDDRRGRARLLGGFTAALNRGSHD